MGACRQQAVLNQEVSADKLEAKAKKVNTKNLFDGILPMLVRPKQPLAASLTVGPDRRA